jgi:hypothetical protein
MTSPLSTTNTPEQNERDKTLWEAENLGGMTEDNNRLPVPIVWLLLLTVLTAFAITFPLWGQRPTAAIYVDEIVNMKSPEIQAMTDDQEAIKKLKAMDADGGYEPQLVRHPMDMNELRMLKPKIEALMNGDQSLVDRPCPKFVDINDYTVVGTGVYCANFEGSYRYDDPSGATKGTRIRQQPWWDHGYTIDIFYVIAFFLGVVIVVKRLPPSSWQPTHGHDH